MVEEIVLGQLLQVQTIPVVAALSLGPLEGLLQQLLAGQKDANEQLQRQQSEIDALKAAAAAAAEEQQGGSQDAAAAMHDLQDQLAGMHKRLSDLEAQGPASTAVLEPDQHAAAAGSGAESSTQGATISTALSPAEAAVTASAPAQGPAGELQALKQQQEQLAQQLADVAAAHRGLQQQVSALGDSKADRADVREMLSEGLRGKADGTAVSQLRSQLGDKADRSELDALLNAISAGGLAEPGTGLAERAGAAAGEAASPVVGAQDMQANGTPSSSSGQPAAASASDAATSAGSSSRRGTREREAGDLPQQLSRLQLQVALLQDRVAKKADSQAVDDLSIGLASTNNTVAGLADSLQDLLQQLAAAQKGLASLQDSLNSHAPNAGMHAGLGQHTAHDTGSPSTARGAQEEQPQLTVLAGKVAVLEAALPGLQAAVAAGAQPRRVSGEQPASSKLVQALAAQLSDLAGQVASLAAQNSSNGGAGSSASAQPCGPSLEDASALSDAEPAAGAGSYPDTAGFGAAGAVLSAELRAEFDGRLSGLEGLVQEVAAMKADATALQELRALLADTATQADTDQIRHKLVAQQSLLDRFARQLSSIGSSQGAGRSSRPQSATGGGSGQHSSAGGITPVAHEHSFFGAAATAAVGGTDRAGNGLPAQHGVAHWVAAAAGDKDAVQGGGWGGDQPDLGGVLGGMQAQLAAHQESLEQLAGAISLLATGQAAPAAPAPAAMAAGSGVAGVQGALGALQVDSGGVDLAAGRFYEGGEGSVPETPNLHFQRPPSMQQPAAAFGATAAGGPGDGAWCAPGRPGTSMGRDQYPAGSQHAAGMEGHWDRQAGFLQPPGAPAVVSAAGPGPQVTRLKRLLQTGQVGRKMDWFDPTLLQKMAQRLAAIDALLRGSGGASPGDAAALSADLEAKLRRLGSEVRHLKDRLAELLGAAGGGAGREGGLRALGQASDGDHSMLSGKPLGGYRCMACDRPLVALDSRPGPYLPTGQLPVSLPSGAEVAVAAGQALGKLPPASASGPRRTRSTAEATAAHAADPLLANSPDGSKRAVGPQNWYASVQGLPAEQLPRADVGPHLPPGGWRGTQPLRGEDGAPLPPVMRGSSTAGGGGATPRAAGSDRGGSQGGATTLR